jgi:hypothetical protein
MKRDNMTSKLGTYIFDTVDLLVEQKNTDALNLMRKAITEIILRDIKDDTVSFIEVGEYMDEALAAFSQGKEPDEVRASSIRKLIKNA